jgi:hypothetical protein
MCERQHQGKDGVEPFNRGGLRGVPDQAVGGGPRQHWAGIMLHTQRWYNNFCGQQWVKIRRGLFKGTVSPV